MDMGPSDPRLKPILCFRPDSPTAWASPVAMDTARPSRPPLVRPREYWAREVNRTRESPKVHPDMISLVEGRPKGQNLSHGEMTGG